jgi:hypothetical protein
VPVGASRWGSSKGTTCRDETDDTDTDLLFAKVAELKAVTPLEDATVLEIAVGSMVVLKSHPSIPMTVRSIDTVVRPAKAANKEPRL